MAKAVDPKPTRIVRCAKAPEEMLRQLGYQNGPDYEIYYADVYYLGQPYTLHFDIDNDSPEARERPALWAWVEEQLRDGKFLQASDVTAKVKAASPINLTIQSLE